MMMNILLRSDLLCDVCGAFKYNANTGSKKSQRQMN